MRIAYIVTRSDLIGGAQVHVRDLAAALVRQGHEPLVLIGGSGPYEEALRQAGIETVVLRHLDASIHPYRDARALGELWSALRRLRPDLVSAHSSKAGVLGRLAARAAGLPVVFTAHGWSFTPGIPRRAALVYRWIERLAAPLASRIIAVSDFDRSLALRHLSIPPERIVTVHNGMSDLGTKFLADPGRSPARLVMIARFEAQKDHTTLFNALALLQAEAWQLDLIGDGALMASAQATAAALGLAERVRFWGQRMDVPQILSQAQMALLISNWEGFPRSILEAMRAGLPVVASQVGGIPESVRDGENGYLIPRGDVERLRDRLSRLIRDAELRTRMGKRGRELFEESFTLEHTLEKTLAVYQELIASPLTPLPDRDPRIAAAERS